MNNTLDTTGKSPISLLPVTSDIVGLRTVIANLYFVGNPGAGDRNWTLVDAGVMGTAGHIKRVAAQRFGEGARPNAIILTHGHFDHVGALRQLADEWEAPIYAHPLELPYLTGRCDYPPPDPFVGGGAVAAMSWTFPRKAMNLGGRVRALPPNGSVPGMLGWRAIHTPGHTAGHVALFRKFDLTLLAGDAFITTQQESLTAVLGQRQEVHGPPSYFTPDWYAARDSVERLAALRPLIAATGHGIPMRGEQLRQELDTLVRDFGRIAVPSQGRYVGEPAIMDERGVVHMPPPSRAQTRTLTALALVAAGAAFVVLNRRKRRQEKFG